MKKDDMAKEVERCLADSGWRCEQLRLAGVDGDPASDANSGGETVGTEQPDFLRTDEESETSADGEDDERHLIAAEGAARGAASAAPHLHPMPRYEGGQCRIGSRR